ncbi:HD domain-containing protein [Sporosarcina sp. ACRSM]|uniref:HD domain-containing protein n=1 Tax=Sporosarcina sp. ACRSM TaxID=2918216 RepID=UPI001EF71266|nr:HD domain-containing protein [Sporosarcina sp. ACRSM]MCG7333833.1 HD domain-containing protein [Sporosarcina sp. ACRSM]
MNTLIEKCEQLVEEIYNQYDASHDFAHIERVLRNAEMILQQESGADPQVVRLAVLLHDIDDVKYQSDDQPTASELLQKIGADRSLSQQVLACIESVSFSGGHAKELTSMEGAIVRDADRLDAIGAIGIARAFAFGGARGRKLYDTNEAARENMSEAEYRSKETASVTHFYEKLLLLKDLMSTKEGKRLAEQRHAFMEAYLKQLDSEVGF